jgi:hypothetical protein
MHFFPSLGLALTQGSLLSNDFKEDAKKHRLEFKNNFQEEFWPVLEDDINGSFHCEYSDSNARVTPAGFRFTFRAEGLI